MGPKNTYKQGEKTSFIGVMLTHHKLTHHKVSTVLCWVRSAVWLPRFQYISWMFSGIARNMGQHIIPNSTEFGADKKKSIAHERNPKSELHETITQLSGKISLIYHLYIANWQYIPLIVLANCLILCYLPPTYHLLSGVPSSHAIETQLLT